MNTLIPYYHNNDIVVPPERYFILPLEEFENKKIGDKYIENGYWVDYSSAKRYLYSTSCRPINKNEELYNRMAFLPERIVMPPEGYYILPANEKIKSDDMVYWFGSNRWGKDGYAYKNRTVDYVYRQYKNNICEKPIAFARKIDNDEKDMSNNFINYNKFPNFVVEIKDNNEAVMLLALGKKYGMKKVNGDFFKSGLPKNNIIYFCKKDNWIYNKNEIRSGYIDCFVSSNCTNTHVYESCDWPAIIKHFEAKVEPDVKVPELYGHKMATYQNDGLVAFDCAKISLDLIKDIVKNYNGNRSVSKIVLDSGKEITKEQAKGILDYVEFVENN